jgi:hypothetical protein
VFNTDKGYTFTVWGLNPYQLELMKTGLKEPEKPTYQLDQSVMAGGVIREEFLDEKSIVVPDNPEETKKNQEKWDAYQLAISRYNGEMFTALIDLCLMDGSILDTTNSSNPVTMEQWHTRQTKRGREFPKYENGDVDQDALYLAFCKEWVLGTMAEMMDFTNVVMERGGMPVNQASLMEALSKAENTFRGDVAG